MCHTYQCLPHVVQQVAHAQSATDCLKSHSLSIPGIYENMEAQARARDCQSCMDYKEVVCPDPARSLVVTAERIAKAPAEARRIRLFSNRSLQL